MGASRKGTLGWDEGVLLWVEAGGQDSVSVRFLVALRAALITQRTI